jgi:hypothetical protein
MSNNPPNINISAQNVEGKCDLKCSYNFKYPESNISAKNNGSFINLTYDNTSVSPVTYNTEKYTVSSIMITSPSIHLFNGSLEAAELTINHVPVKGGNQLSVSIPIKSSSESSTASNLIADIIQSVATNAPSNGESTSINIPGFTLDKIVPNKPFYSYTSNSIDWIVFGDLEAIPLNSSILNTLGQIIKPFPIPTPGAGLFFNSSGPNTSLGSPEGIYISCQPTGSSEEEIGVEYSKNTVSYDLSSILTNPNTAILFQIVIGCIVFIMLFLVLNYVYTYLTSDAPKIPTFNIPKNPFRRI